ncbi:GPW/gp25 family protein [Paenibacillus sp. GCM10027626]|uniref:GPW/gp25 family protein n=1 Tax=Paenibacillus sp. GCM10027626 TaxID=3273411 RepID=UPI003636E5AB
MEYTATTKQKGIIFGATGLEAIHQNVRTIITTIRNTVPLDRGFGLDASGLDAPSPIAQARMTEVVFNAINDFEPRVEVVSIEYEQDNDEGQLVPTVKYTLREGVEI